MDPVADLVRLLARRPATRAEGAQSLRRKGHDEASIEDALDHAAERGWIDDAKLAYDFIVARTARLGRGRDRLVAELEARGVERATALAAWRRAAEAGDLDEDGALQRAVRRRIAAGGGLADERRYARVYNALLRDGFDKDAVEAALEPHRAVLDRSVERLAEGNDR
jgi:regulatory protein